jgi:signal transduction protein with GAF and PtsI domain
MAAVIGKGKKKPAGSLKEACFSPQEFSWGVEFVRSLDPKAGLDATLRNIARLASRLSGGDGCLVHLLDRERNLLEAACRHGAGRTFAAPLKPGQGVSGSAFRRKKPVSVADLMKEPAGPWVQAAKKEGFTSALSLPLRGRQSTLGTITLLRRQARPHGAAELALFHALADQAGVAVDDAGSYEKLLGRLKTLSREKKREGQIKTFLENIVDRSADPIMATDLHGRFTFVSRGAEEMFGLSKEELLGKPISPFYAGGQREAKKIMKVLAKKEKL